MRPPPRVTPPHIPDGGFATHAAQLSSSQPAVFAPDALVLETLGPDVIVSTPIARELIRSRERLAYLDAATRVLAAGLGVLVCLHWPELVLRVGRDPLVNALGGLTLASGGFVVARLMPRKKD